MLSRHPLFFTETVLYRGEIGVVFRGRSVVSCVGVVACVGVSRSVYGTNEDRDSIGRSSRLSGMAGDDDHVMLYRIPCVGVGCTPQAGSAVPACTALVGTQLVEDTCTVVATPQGTAVTVCA